MDFWQKWVVLVFSLFSLLVSIKGFYESAKKNNSYGETVPLVWMGIFVWGDAVIFGLFWFLAALICFLLKDWVLFLLIISVFWLVRSLGETIYYFNQQFSTINRQPPKKLRGYQFFKNDAIWFVYQIFCQCLTVVSIITTIYLANLWLKTR